MRDMDSGTVLFDIEAEEREDVEDDSQIPDEDKILKYHFGPDFLLLKNIGTQVTFSVGGKEVRNFRMIERHYFKDNLLKSFDFKFPFCIPNTTNTWEHIYTLP